MMRQASATPRPAKRQRTETAGRGDAFSRLGPRLGALLRWLQESGAEGLEALEFRASSLANGGLGVFVGKDRQTLKPGDLIARIPQSCVLTADKALASDVGRACVGANPECTDEFVLIIWIAVGRLDENHPFHAYLSSLPGR